MLGRTPKTLERSDAVVDTTPTEGNMIRVKTPKFVSLVGKPANSVGFKVLRSDKGDNPMNNPIIRRQRRSDASPVLRLAFPAGTDEAAVNEALKNYGLSGYTIEQTDGVYTATRSDLKSISNEKTMQIKLSDDGLTATVARQDAGVEAAEEKSQLAMVSLEFDSTKFTSDEVKAWLTEKSVDGEMKEPENPDESYVVRRSETLDGEETRRMQLEDGVTAVIVRADVSNVPDGFVAVVSEAAYGGWGWGQLDFTAMMADVAFSEQMDDSIYRLKNLLQNIVLWSNLPLDVRKELTSRAMSQFGEYVNTLMDSLPRQLLVSVVRSANPQLEKTMTTQDKSGAGTGNQAQTKTDEDNKPLTRSDVAAMIAEGIAAGLKAHAEAAPTGAPVVTEKRADGTGEPTAGAGEKTDETKTEDKPLTRADFKALVDEAVKPINEAVEQLKGTTIVRSAGEQNTTVVKETVKDVFRGAMPGLRSGEKV